MCVSYRASRASSYDWIYAIIRPSTTTIILISCASTFLSSTRPFAYAALRSSSSASSTPQCGPSSTTTTTTPIHYFHRSINLPPLSALIHSRRRSGMMSRLHRPSQSVRLARPWSPRLRSAEKKTTHTTTEPQDNQTRRSINRQQIYRQRWRNHLDTWGKAAAGFAHFPVQHRPAEQDKYPNGRPLALCIWIGLHRCIVLG